MSENMPQSSATAAGERNANLGVEVSLERKDGARYEAFLHSKVTRAPERGLVKVPALHPSMFPHQRDVTEFLLRAGSGAAFLDTGLGKSLVALDWGRVIAEHTGKPVLMLAPLAVSRQHAREAAKFGLPAVVAREPDELHAGVNICNYEMLHHFKPGMFGGLILDESSIIKSFTGKTTRALIEFGKGVQFKLACTATPAPNDHMELGQHSQFLGAMDSSEMLARWFIADQRNMGRYRLKRYAVESFWSWVASWARCISKPSDMGYSDDGFVLPPLNLHKHIVEQDITHDTGGMLFRIPDTSATQIHKEKRITADSRAQRIAEVVSAEPSEPWVIWVETDYEADAVARYLPHAVEVRGSMPNDLKERRLIDFTENGGIIVTKPSIAGFGLNWQHCRRVAFAGLSFSYEQFYQAVRRCWRFGQTSPVEVHVAMADTEEAIWRTVQRKQSDHEDMKVHMYAAMRRAVEVRGVKLGYEPQLPANLPDWIKSA